MKNVQKIMLQLMPACADELSTFVYDFMLEASYTSEAFLSAEAMAKSFTTVRNEYATEYYVEFSLFPSTKLRMSNKLRKALLKMLRDLAKSYRLDSDVSMSTLRVIMPCGLVDIYLSDKKVAITCYRK